MTVSVNASTSQELQGPPRPKDVGILAVEMYFPQRVRLQRAHHQSRTV